MKSAFFNLDRDKSKRIINEAIREFSENPYSNASLNSIVKNSGISKGGLFKYIENKEDLYLYIIGGIIERVISFQIKRVPVNRDFLERFKGLLISGIAYYKDSPTEFKCMLQALVDINSPLYGKVTELKNRLILKHQKEMLEGINWEVYTIPKDQVLLITDYITQGYNLDLLRRISTFSDIRSFQKSLMKDIDLILNTLKHGIIGGKKC